MHKLTKNEAIDIILNMLEGCCKENREEVISTIIIGISDDELTANIKSLDLRLFGNFYTRTLGEDITTRKTKKMSNVIVDLTEFEENIISVGLKLVENSFREQNKEIRERGDNPLFTDDFMKSYIENIRLKLGIKSENQ